MGILVSYVLCGYEHDWISRLLATSAHAVNIPGLLADLLRHYFRKIFEYNSSDAPTCHSVQLVAGSQMISVVHFIFTRLFQRLPSTISCALASVATQPICPSRIPVFVSAFSSFMHSQCVPCFVLLLCITVSYIVSHPLRFQESVWPRSSYFLLTRPGGCECKVSRYIDIVSALSTYVSHRFA